MPMLTDGLLFELELFCEPVSGCGVTIVGSRSSGIAIKSLLPGGIADQDGRLQEGDKIVSINGRPAWCLTCGQVARCLRQNDTVILGIHRADRYDRYDYMNSSLYCGSSRRSTMRDSVSSDSPRSISSSTSSSDSQDSCDMDVTSQTLSTDFDSSSNAASSSISPFYTCSSSLLQKQKALADSRCQNRNSVSSYESQNKRHSVPLPGTVTSSYNMADKWRRLVKYFSRQSECDLENTIELTMKTCPNYEQFCNTSSISSSMDMESSSLTDDNSPRRFSETKSADQLIPPGLYIG